MHRTLWAGLLAATGLLCGCSSSDDAAGGAGGTLYARLGSEAGIGAVVDDFLAMVLSDPKINGYFLNSSVGSARLKTCLVKQLGNATGGPQKYPDPAAGCRDMKTIHAGLGISKADFDVLVGHLTMSLASAQVTPADIDTITGVLAPLSSDIVEDTTSDKTVYQRVGRKPAIQKVVDEFVAAVAADASINGFFAADRLPRLKTCLTRQVCSIDGPCKYGSEVGASVGEAEPGVSADSPCQGMLTTHAALKNAANGNSPITIADFNTLVGHLVTALDANGVAASDKNAVLGVLGPLCADIVADATTCP